jgi:hypothetical protein
MVTRFRRRDGDRASLHYDRLCSEPALERWQEFERRVHGFDVAIILGLTLTVLGVPAVSLMLWLLRA